MSEHKLTGDCFAGACEICNPPNQYVDWRKRAEAAEAEVERLRNSIDHYARFIEGRCRLLCACGKVAKRQTAKGEHAQANKHLPQNWGLYCNKCFKEGLELEHEAIHH